MIGGDRIDCPVEESLLHLFNVGRRAKRRIDLKSGVK